jgi:hypothetical protein
MLTRFKPSGNSRQTRPEVQIHHFDSSRINPGFVRAVQAVRPLSQTPGPVPCTSLSRRASQLVTESIGSPVGYW